MSFRGGLQYLPLFSTIVALCLGGRRPLALPFVVAALACNKVRNLNVLRVMLRITNIGSLSSKFEILQHPIFLASI